MYFFTLLYIATYHMLEKLFADAIGRGVLRSGLCETVHLVVQNTNMEKFEINIETNIYKIIISKQNQYRNAFSGYFITNTDTISIFWSFFDTITNKWFETKQFRTGLVWMLE